MDSAYYQVAAGGFVLLTFLCLGGFFWGLRYGLNRAALPPVQKKRIWWGSLLGISLWIIFVSVLSWQGVFSDFSSFPPKMGINIILPLIVVLSVSFRPSTLEILRHIPAHWILGLQSFRIPVEIFLWCLFMAGVLPFQMTFEGYNFDILSGIGGLVLALLILRGITINRTALWIYNMVGLLLLATIVTIALLSFPTPMRQFMNEPDNSIIVTFPFVWLPAILVVLAYTLHIFSIRQLRADIG